MLLTDTVKDGPGPGLAETAGAVHVVMMSPESCKMPCMMMASGIGIDW